MKRARATAIGALLLLSCTAGEPASAPTPTPSVSAPATTPAVQSGDTKKPHPVSIPALSQTRFNGRALKLGTVLARAADYTRYAVTYESGSLTISGVLNVPHGRGPFPALVLNHGYIDPAIYTTGRGLKREQDYLARKGFVVLHTDYRNHAGSDDDPKADLNMRLGYVEDAINAVHALRATTEVPVDDDRIGMLGRSMGGGVTLTAAVVAPGLVDAFVVYAPVSADVIDNFHRWTTRRPALAERILDTYGTREDNPGFWRDVSAVNFFDRVTEPIVIHHGTNDESVPIAWSRDTVAALEEQGKRVAFYVYEGEAHAFGPQWQRSMERTVAFLRKHLR